MNTIFIFIFTFFSTTSYCLANDSFNEIFEYQHNDLPQFSDDIIHHFNQDSKIPSKKRIVLFETYQQSLKQQLKQNPDNPIFWFIAGLNYKNTLTALEWQASLGARNIQPIIAKTQLDMQHAFKQAMHFDKHNKSRLTARIYATMKQYLSDYDRVIALQKELALGGSGDNETQYWFSHWDNIGSLQDLGRYEEAEDALKKMQKELKIAGLENSEFNTIYEKAYNNLAAEHSLDQNSKIPESSPAPQKIAEKPSQLFNELEEKLETYWLMILINILVVISLVIAFIKREK